MGGGTVVLISMAVVVAVAVVVVAVVVLHLKSVSADARGGQLLSLPTPAIISEVVISAHTGKTQ